jgi:D-lactate dehydrogenase
MQIAFFGVNQEEENILSELLSGVGELVFYKEVLRRENAHKAHNAQIVSMFVGAEADSKVIDLIPNAKLLVTRSTGYDHVDIAYAEKKGIKVANVPAYGSHTVAEFTFALILMLSRKVHEANHNLREGMNFDISELRGFDLYGKTLGVVGLGKIGQNVAKIAQGFGMKVIGCDKYPDKDFLKTYNFSCVKLLELLKQADIVTLHVPHTKETHHLINSKNISLMRDGAYLINTARGEVVETDALVKALQSKKLAGAGLDVLEGERELKEEIELVANQKEWHGDFKTLLENHILIELPNVIVTPHIAFYTREAERRILETTSKNIKAFINDQPQNLVSVR